MNTRIVRVLHGLALSALCTAAQAADGDLDTSFGDNGFRLAGTTEGYSTIPSSMAVQADGKILICNGEGVSPAIDFVIVRFTADGELDTTFSFDGRTAVDFDGDTDLCNGVAVQADGKIVAAGTTTEFGVTSDFAIARLNADGTLDTATFGAGTGKSVIAFDVGGTNLDTAGGLALRSDGKIVVVGSANTDTNGDDFAIVQLNSDGSRDTGFNLTGRVTVGFDLPASTTKFDMATRVVIDEQNRIIVAGTADAGPAASDFAVVRLLPGGQPDPDFSADGRTTIAFDLGGANGSNSDGAYHLMLQRDGRIVAAGVVDSSTTATSNIDMGFVRLLPDGSPDAGFGIGGKTTIAFDLGSDNSDLALTGVEQSNGKLLFGGASNTTGASNILADAVRLNRDGSPDESFGTLGKKSYDFAQTVPSGQLFNAAALHGSGIVFGGAGYVIDDTHVDAFVARILIDLIFADGFD
jgi:uncharacterized delta-60 repeat protein